MLREEFLKPLALGIDALARELLVPPGRVGAIVNGKRAICADTALRLGRYLGTSPQFWLTLQAEFELRMVQRTTWPKVERRFQPRRMPRPK